MQGSGAKRARGGRPFDSRRRRSNSIRMGAKGENPLRRPCAYPEGKTLWLTAANARVRRFATFSSEIFRRGSCAPEHARSPRKSNTEVGGPTYIVETRQLPRHPRLLMQLVLSSALTLRFELLSHSRCADIGVKYATRVLVSSHNVTEGVNSQR